MGLTRTLLNPIEKLRQMRFDPDTIWNSNAKATFIYTRAKNLWEIDGNETHGDLIEQNPQLQDELTKIFTSLGKTNWNYTNEDGILESQPWQLRHGIMDYPAALMGRIGIVANTQVCAFWSPPEHLEQMLLKPCLQALLNKQLIKEDTVVRIKGNTEYAKDVIAGITPSQSITQDDRQLLHLLQGNNKKQELMKMGATPKKPTPNLNPGQKYWALNSEHFSFKQWLTNN